MTFSNRINFYLTGTSRTSGTAYESILTLIVKTKEAGQSSTSLTLTTSVNQALEDLRRVVLFQNCKGTCHRKMLVLACRS